MPTESPTPFLAEAPLLFVWPAGVWEVVLAVGAADLPGPVDAPGGAGFADETAMTAPLDVLVPGKGVDATLETGLLEAAPVCLPTVVATHVVAPMTVTVVAASTVNRRFLLQQNPGFPLSSSQQYSLLGHPMMGSQRLGNSNDNIER